MHMRCSIWEQHLQQIPDADADLDLDEVIQALSQEPLNGREIFNAINTAQTLARFQKEPLRMNHLQKILLVRKEFVKSLEKEKRKVMAASTGNSQVMIGSRRSNSILDADDVPEI